MRTCPWGLAVFFVCAWSFAVCPKSCVLGGILALQAADGVHLGVDNLGVVRHVGRLLDGNVGSRPAELVKDGDLILLIGRTLRPRCLDTVRSVRPEGEVKSCRDMCSVPGPLQSIQKTENVECHFSFAVG